MQGEFDMVRRVLCHVAKCIQDHTDSTSNARVDQDDFLTNESDRINIPPIISTLLLQRSDKQEEVAPTVVGTKMRGLLDKFASVTVDDVEEENDLSTPKSFETTNIQPMNEEELPFREAHAILKSNLTRVQLPDVSSSDQLTLMAITNTCYEIPEAPSALDGRAIRYLVAVKIAQHLKTGDTPLKPIKSPFIAWALFSDSQQVLWTMSFDTDNNNTSWNTIQSLGVVYWLRNQTTLKQIGEALARDQFRSSQQPTDVALLYLSLRKKTALVQLFRAKRMDKQAEFFSRDFNVQKNREAAAKNAFLLLGKHNFEYAAAFFVLADMPKDAIDVLVKKSHDYQLAYLVARLYCGDDSEITNQFLSKHLLPLVKTQGDYWLETCIGWILKDYQSTLTALVDHQHDETNFDPSYYALSTFISSQRQCASVSHIVDDKKQSIILRTIHHHIQMGEHMMTFKYVHKLNNVNVPVTRTVVNQNTSQNIASGTFDFFGGGMGGGMGMFGGGMGMGQPMTSSQPVKKKAPTPDMKEIIYQTKLKIILQILSQDVHDANLQEWDSNKIKLFNQLNQMCERFNVNTSDLKCNLVEYCDTNGLIVGRCLLLDDAVDMMKVISAVTHQIVASLSLLSKKLPSPAQLFSYERIVKELVGCYNKVVSMGYVPSSTEKADLGITIYVIIFTLCYSKSDWENISILFELYADVDQLSKALSNDPIAFLELFKETSKDQVSDRKLREAIQREEKARAKRSKTATTAQPATVDYSAYIKAYKERGRKKQNQQDDSKAESDALIDRLKSEFYSDLFVALVVMRLTGNIRAVIKKSYEPNKQSLTANDASLCLNYWCSYLSSKLFYQEAEIYSLSNQYPTPNFKDMNSLSSYSQLIVGDALLSSSSVPNPTQRTRSRSRAKIVAPVLLDLHAQQDIKLRIAQHWFQPRKHPEIEKMLKDVHVARIWNNLSNVNNQRILGVQVPYTYDTSMADTDQVQSEQQQPTTSPTSSSTAFTHHVPCHFSAEVEIVKSREPIRAMCIDQNNPSYLAYASGKIIREINIQHSIKYRKRNPTLDKLQDEEAATWEASLHRFDDIAARDDMTTSVQMGGAILPSNAGFGLFDFLRDEGSHPMDSFETAANQGALNRIKNRLKMARKPSFTGASSASHFKSSSTTTNGTPQSKRKSVQVATSNDHHQNVHALISHPYLPFYLSGGSDGAIHMFQFGASQMIRTYREANSPPITSLRFSHFGYKFGATDTSGQLTLWRFEANKESLQSFAQLQCHASHANGFTFMDSASVVATIGTGPSSKNLFVWDLLMPIYDANVYGAAFHDEPSSVLYCSRYNTLLVGTRKGDISVVDVRTKNHVKSFSAHPGSVLESMSLDMTQEFFLTGCSDGDVKIWDMRTMDLMHGYKQTHRSGQMFSMGSSGVTDMHITGQFFYSGGADGRILRRAIL